MTSRSAWLLIGTALGVAALPGCLLCRDRHDGSPAICKDAPPLEITRSNAKKDLRGPSEEPAAGSIHGQTAQLPVTEGSQPPLEPPVPEILPNQQGVAGYSPAEAPLSKPIDIPKDAPKRSPLVEALESILEGRHQDALRQLQAYDAETQEFYLRILPTLTIFTRKRIDELTAVEIAVLNEQLQSLLATLRPRTELVIDRMCFCEWVRAYGIYQPLTDAHAFVAPSGERPGELVRLYVEVRNFASVPRGNCYETRLASAIEIRDAQGKRVHVLDFKDGKEPLKSLTRLNDYYNTYTFPVPELPPGTYQLVLELSDDTLSGARRVAQKTLEFRVTAVGTRP
jgi:hypothetical protein